MDHSLVLGRGPTSCHCWYFSDLPPPNHACNFYCTWLSSIVNYVRDLDVLSCLFTIHEPSIARLPSHRSSICDVLMARSTNDHCFAASRCHQLYPLWLFLAFVPVQVFESSNMVHLDVLSVTAVLALVC